MQMLLSGFRRSGWFRPLVAAASISIGMGSTGRAADPIDSEGDRLFAEKIRPVLEASCFGCHSSSAEKLKGGLRLDSREALLLGGDSGPVVVPGRPGESPLIQSIRHETDLAMPPKKPKLADSVIGDFERWVNLGVPFPGGEGSGASSEASRRHWSFQPVTKVDPPAVRDAGWVRTPVDGFILATLEAKGWKPAPEAERPEWIRRVTFDLTGLPPSPEEIESFVQDPAPDAFERVVDRLLAGPRYGERWGQHWLDVVRFAETEGYEYDRTIPDAWRFRDYVIDSLNRDKPFDRFLIEQIAGDEIAPDDPECQVASTFHRLGPVRRNAGDSEIALSRNEVLTDRTDILGTAILGLTVGCARCHNHKLEPISQKDYYQLQAYLAATQENDISLASKEAKAKWDQESGKIKEELKLLKARIKEATGDRKLELEAELEALEDRTPPPLPTIPGTRNDFENRTAIHVLKRGVWEKKGEPVGPRPPGILVADDLPELEPDVRDPRTRLARWLVDPRHPLTPRVLANRLWQNHFGAGLVKTVNDFGTKGDRPSHPELLDWLAATLVEGGWQLKPIHRLLVLSNTYRQSGRSPMASEYAVADPENRLLWHASRRRLTAEEIRDTMLAVSGRLNPRAGGPSVMLPIDQTLVNLLYKPSQWQVAASRDEHDRRSIYLFAKRNLRLPFFETFDAPALLNSCARRESSTHAPQALELLNGSLSNDLAASFARRLEAESGGDPDRLVDRAFRLAIGRPPTDEERSISLAFLRDQTREEFALAVFNLNGFLYVP
ncbi:PSD1 and planctomycete cytochrome C domain-containing protein [Tundrisphaera lichenicola]|uniref:PSD1 and planctomycete cytochrome C domain-containing protein n=1 Tax=Tundrisphaera lichenicola TaxID=2029860 RepID=UPI003EBEE4A6